MTKTPSTPPSWNLKDLYISNDSPQLKIDITTTTDRVKRFAKLFKGKVMELHGDVLGSTIKEYEDIQDILGKISAYAYLLYAEDLSKPENTAFYQDISEQINDISTNILFFTLEINKISDEKLAYKLANSTKLQHYEPWLRDIRVMQPHQLEDNVEEILHEKSITSRHSWSRGARAGRLPPGCPVG